MEVVRSECLRLPAALDRKTHSVRYSFSDSNATARGWPELVKAPEMSAELLQKVTLLYGVRPYCPDLGKYTVCNCLL